MDTNVSWLVNSNFAELPWCIVRFETIQRR